jgi:hypothetical protein
MSMSFPQCFSISFSFRSASASNRIQGRSVSEKSAGQQWKLARHESRMSAQNHHEFRAPPPRLASSMQMDISHYLAPNPVFLPVDAGRQGLPTPVSGPQTSAQGQGVEGSTTPTLQQVAGVESNNFRRDRERVPFLPPYSPSFRS